MIDEIREDANKRMEKTVSVMRENFSARSVPGGRAPVCSIT